MGRRLTPRRLSSRIADLITMEGRGLESHARRWPSRRLNQKLWQYGLKAVVIGAASIAAVWTLLAFARGEVWLLLVCMASAGLLALLCLPSPIYTAWVLLKEKRRRTTLVR